MNWRLYRDEIEQKRLKSPTWLSDQESLLDFIDQFEKLSVKPPSKKITISNLRQLIKYLREPINGKEVEKIIDLLRTASELSNRDLRLFLGSTKLEEVQVIQTEKSPIALYQITLTKGQLDKIIAATKLNFDFQFIESDK